MKTQWVMLLIVLGAFNFFPQTSLADDLADLKAAHMSYSKAWNTGDVEAGMELFIEGAIMLTPDLAFPAFVKKSGGFKKAMSKWYETHTSRERYYKPDYRVIGNTGLVWGTLNGL